MGITYSFKDIDASLISPTAALSLGYGAGVAEGGITIEMASDRNSMVIGTDGTGMHSLHVDRSGHVTIRMLQTSPTNAVLQDLYDYQTQAGASAWGQMVLTIRNVQSGDVTTATQCAFKRKPTITYQKDGTMYEWQFDAVAIDTVLGTY